MSTDPLSWAVFRNYQRKGVAWLSETLRHHKAVLLCDDPGLGKTLQALAAAHQLHAKRVLVVCPAGARMVWSREIAKWFPAWESRTFVVEPGVQVSAVARIIGGGAAALILIVSYDEMSRQESRLPLHLANAAWDLLILDEAHYLKNPSNRTVTLYGRTGSNEGIQGSASHVILLTGTPTPNHAGELYQHVRTFWPSTITTPRKQRPMTLAEFEERYTRYRDTVYGRQVSGSKNQAELRAALSEVVLRRRKDEVLPELPPLVLQDIPLGPPPQDRRLSDAARQLARRLTSALSPLTRDGGDNQLIKALRTPDGPLTTLRRELGELKVQPTIAWVQECMHSTNKIILFAWHHSVIEHLRRGLAEFDPVTITGDTSPAGRVNAIDMFQHRAGVRVFIGQVLAAGTAITLTAANEVAIVEPSWVPGENVQAICRAHRLGQRDSVLASFLYLPGTLDERIMATFRRKAAEISELQGDFDSASTSPAALRPGRSSRSRSSAVARQDAKYDRAGGRNHGASVRDQVAV